MKLPSLWFTCCLGIATCAAPAWAVRLDFVAAPGCSAVFGGGTFSFNPASGSLLTITSVENGSGNAVGKGGFLSPVSSFSIGPVTAHGSAENAPLAGMATLRLADGSGSELTGTLEWIDVTTSGSLCVLNISGTANVTSLQYSGSLQDFKDLAATGTAICALSLQFGPPRTLDDLITSGGASSFSGAIASVVPEPGPATLAICGGAILLAAQSPLVRRLKVVPNRGDTHSHSEP